MKRSSLRLSLALATAIATVTTIVASPAGAAAGTGTHSAAPQAPAAPMTTGATAAAGTGAGAAPVRIMPLGDSLTGGPGCWRALLWTRLRSAGYTNLDFVGTLPGGGCGVADWDGDNEGHGGALAITTAEQKLLPRWLAATKPDIVMMNFGTNDIWNRRPTADIMAAFNTLLDQMRQQNPGIRVLVAKIAPVAPPGCDTCQPATVELNSRIGTWATTKTTSRSPVTAVDHWTGWVPGTDTLDGVHQSDAGNQKMATTWYEALARRQR